MSRASKEYSNSLQDKVKRLIQTNHQLREELEALQTKYKELEAFYELVC